MGESRALRTLPAGFGRVGARQWALRLLGTCAFTALALWGVGLSGVARSLEQLSPLWLLTALGFLAVSHVVASVRWWLLLRGAGVPLRLPETLRLFFVGLFFTNVLPTGFGGDAVRAWRAGRRTGSMEAATASVLADRLSSVWALGGLGVVAASVGSDDLPPSILDSVLMVSLIIAGGSVLLFSRRPLALTLRLLARWPRAGRALGSTHASLQRLRGRPGLLMMSLGLSVASQVAVVAAAWCLAQGLDLDLSPVLLAATIPVVLMITAVPASINGLGIREVAFRALLVPAGVGPADAVAFSLATAVAGLLISLPGAIWWLARKGASGEAESPHPALG